MRKVITGLITFYQKYLSFDHGLLIIFAPGGACRFKISCSEYLKQAIINKGVLKGTWLGFKRLVRCNPYV